MDMGLINVAHFDKVSDLMDRHYRHERNHVLADVNGDNKFVPATQEEAEELATIVIDAGKIVTIQTYDVGCFWTSHRKDEDNWQ